MIPKRKSFSPLLLALVAACSPPGAAPSESTTSGSVTTSGDGDTSNATTSSTTGTSAGTTAGDTSNDTATGGDGDGDTIPGEAPGGVKLNGSPEYYGVVRLTHEQWKNSIQDIFSSSDATGELIDTLYPDPPSGTFSNNEKGLYVGAELWADYQRSVEEIAETVVNDDAAISTLGGLSNATGFIERVGRRAYRRALTSEESTKYQALWAEGATFYASGDAGKDGARIFVRALLQSPQFVYRTETAEHGTRLSGLELAAKLSLLLRNTTPSEELLTAAESGELDTDAGLTSLVTTMLAEDDAKAALLGFHTTLYGLDRYRNIEKSATTFPEFTETAKVSLQAADSMFFDAIYSQDGGFRDILTSPLAFVNSDIASAYGLQSNSTELTQVTLDGSRPGFLTRAGFLTYNASLSQSDPIHRGVDINLKMLCKELSPPPGTIPPLPDPIPGQSNRERVEAHTGDAICAQCHKTIINPLGFAFENFDALGHVRTEEAGKPVNTADSYEFNDGIQSFNDSGELIAILADHQQTHSCYSARLTEFLLARDLASLEEALVTTVFESSFTDSASIRQMVLSTILDPMFTHAQAGDAQ